ncbi:hypothetical protein FBUS_10140 [Fasciolopsis buskii]|uniref:Striatin N-terminal domain-containing protein n=1 Tax=Fasciolopsis buskii TaxID=27845 RepID=A0A8E0RV34_9TREM|nr:hypothetical protein FBUS_10140 [Fasciolopsis buski]
MAGRLEGQMDEFNHPGINSYDRSCDATAATQEQKKPTPQYTLQGALHFLQTEWTRLEMQRFDWETDRAELKVSSKSRLNGPRALAPCDRSFCTVLFSAGFGYITVLRRRQPR